MKSILVAGIIIVSSSVTFAQRKPTDSARAAELVKKLTKVVASPTCFSVETAVKRVTGQEEVNELSQKITSDFVKAEGFEFSTLEGARLQTAENAELHLRESYNAYAILELLDGYIKEGSKEERQELRKILGNRFSPAYHVGWYDDGAEITGRDLFILPLLVDYDKKTVDVLSVAITYCDD